MRVVGLILGLILVSMLGCGTVGLGESDRDDKIQKLARCLADNAPEHPEFYRNLRDGFLDYSWFQPSYSHFPSECRDVYTSWQSILSHTPHFVNEVVPQWIKEYEKKQ